MDMLQNIQSKINQMIAAGKSESTSAWNPISNLTY